MNDLAIKQTIYSIIKEITNGKYDITEKERERGALYFIVTESTRATNFIVSIEDEFNVEFDDDDIDLNFFSSIERIVNLIKIRSN